MKTESTSSNNTTGSERWDLQILQKRMTQRSVQSKKVYKRKPRNNKYGSDESI